MVATRSGGKARDPDFHEARAGKSSSGSSRAGKRTRVAFKAVHQHEGDTSYDDEERPTTNKRKRGASSTGRKKGTQSDTKQKEDTAVGRASPTARTPRARPPLAPRTTSDSARFAHVGKRYSPGNGQNDYELTAPEPWRDDDGQWRFDDYPTFLPNLSPEEILRQGSFGGGFFRPVFSKKSGRELHDDWEDLPREWISGLDVSEYLTRNEGQETEVNKWHVKVGQSYEDWEKAGWIMPQHDARGWFQWYCRFFRGRRIGEEDERQVGRWERLAGERGGRWRRIYYGKCLKMRINEIERDEERASKGIRQTLNHWAYEPTTTHLFQYLDEKGVPVANDEDAGDLL